MVGEEKRTNEELGRFRDCVGEEIRDGKKPTLSGITPQQPEEQGCAGKVLGRRRRTSSEECFCLEDYI